MRNARLYLIATLAACTGSSPRSTLLGPDDRTAEATATILAAAKHCKAPQILCGSACIDPRTDFNNCGTCGNACSTNHLSGAACSAGTCTGTCDPGWGDCNGDKSCAGGGCEASLIAAQTDSPAGYPIAGFASGGITNCGACGQTCAATNPDASRQAHTTNLCVPTSTTAASCRFFDRARCATARCIASTYVTGRGETQSSLAADAGPDTDADGIPDAWETANADPRTLASNPIGVDIDCDGKIDAADFQFPASDLPAVGVRDAYLRIRSMPQDPGTGGPCASDNDCAADLVGPWCDTNAGQCSDEPSTGHAPGSDPIAMVKSAFAPHNAALHVAAADGSALLPAHAQYLKFFTDDACINLPAASYFTDLKPTLGFGDNTKEQYVYRFMVFAHDWCVTPGTTGNSEILGNDSSVTLGLGMFGVDPATAKVAQAGTLMHELGHTLGLTHYPMNDVLGRPLKPPHYLSVMNYRYQLSGISQVQTPVANTVNSVPVVPNTQRVDYSTVALASLDESSLDENAGIGAGTDDAVYYVCPNGAARVGWAGGPINWNCDGSSSDVGVVDANIDGDIATDPTPQVLAGREDWSRLNFNMLCAATFAN